MNTYIKQLFMVILLAFSAQIVHAQMQKRSDRIHAIKVGFITDKLKLTSDQSASFWPVYNQYETDIRALRKGFIDKYRQANSTATDAKEANQFISDNLDYQEELVKVKKQYREKFLKIITPQQLAQLYQSEREFKKLLLDRLRAGDNTTIGDLK